MAPRFGQPHALYLRDSVALPAELLPSIPTCAQSCVSSQVADGLVPSECKSPSDAACLCSHYSTSGFALGELVLGCMIEHCPAGTVAASRDQAYRLCSSYSNAVVATHAVLTMTTSFQPTTSTSSSQTTQPTTIPTTSTTFATSASDAVISTPTSNVTISSSASPTGLSATPTQPSRPLSTGQTVGISVASIAIAALIFGLCFFCCCCVRRRKKEKKDKKCGTPTRKWFKTSHRLDFQDQSSPTGSKFAPKSTTRPATPSGPARPPRSFPASPNRSPRSSLSSFDKSPEATTQRRFRPSLRPQLEWWKESSRLDIRQVPDGLKSHRASISSPGCSGTRSPRLPNSITNIMINVKKASKHLGPDSAATRWTVFEEDSRTSTHKTVLPNPPVLPKPVFQSPIRPPPGPSFADQYTTSPEEMTKSGLMLQIPRKPVRNDEVSLSNGISLNTGASRNDHLSMPPSSAASYLPAYYTSSDSRTPVAPKWSPNDHERYSQPHFAPLPLVPRGVRSSWASATTFESVDPDETTPENEVDKQLSPVSYPKVPRPSNQAIPRSPPSTTSSRKVTLAAKRRGEDLSLDLGRGLIITNIREAPESPLRNYSRRNQKRTDQTPQMELKSPLWEPKLTPSRRGDDLYLSVEVKGR
ncbi:unnamed protein product [Aureobasidium vineae]|uniref:CFEM domain-containing protein n=1 Tax=Aureobasidium vineae TaxID=2773715 RepID=A0A9N8PJT7_9PEZI|nr:unnamed protein product [Aureobasidium vineae]